MGKVDARKSYQSRRKQNLEIGQTSERKNGHNIYNIKPGSNGIGKRCKCRLVARGFQHKGNIDYYETFASVVKYNTIKSIVTLMGTYSWETHHMDIKAIYLDSKLQEKVYMQQPLG